MDGALHLCDSCIDRVTLVHEIAALNCPRRYGMHGLETIPYNATVATRGRVEVLCMSPLACNVHP